MLIIRQKEFTSIRKAKKFLDAYAKPLGTDNIAKITKRVNKDIEFAKRAGIVNTNFYGKSGINGATSFSNKRLPDVAARKITNKALKLSESLGNGQEVNRELAQRVARRYGWSSIVI